MKKLERGTPAYDRVLEAVKDGSETKAVARKFGVSRRQVSAIRAHETMRLRDATYHVRHEHLEPGTKLHEKVVKLVRAGIGTDEISRKTKVAVRCVAAIKAKSTAGCYKSSR